MATTYGAALPDCEPLVHSRVSSYISLLPSFSQFLSQISTESISHSNKVSSLIGNYRKQTSSTSSERGGGDGGGSTLEIGLARVLEEMDLGVREVGIRGEKELKLVSQVMGTTGNRLDQVRKKHHEHYKKLLSERDRLQDQREKSKSLYYSSCESVESARQKKASSKPGSKDLEKATKAYDHAVEEMGIAKNQYLLDIDLSNVAKEKLYNQHLPNLEDDYQALEHSTTLQFVQSLEKMIQIQLESLERIGQTVKNSLEELKKIEPEKDQDTFVNRYSGSKLAAWELPPDAVFEECSVWHDTDEFSTSPTSITYLQNVQLKASSRLKEVSPMFETKKRELTGLKNLRETYEQQPGLGGDTLGVIENLYSMTHDITLLELTQTEQTSLIELISATLGEEGGSERITRGHDFKPSHFVTPSSCVVCQSSIWGKGLKCSGCSLVCHPKCELKVPVGCGKTSSVGVGGGGAGVVRSHSKAGGSLKSGMSNLNLDRTNSSSAGSINSNYETTSTSSSIPPPRRSVPPPLSTTTATSTASTTSKNLPLAQLMYDYQAATAFELTVSEGDQVEILEPQDSSGWTKIKTKDGREGLVPGSYLQQLSSSPSATSSVPETGSSNSGGQQVVAIYSYTPTQGTTDELSIVEGQVLILVGKGMEYGDGWAEVEIKDNSRERGLVPASYIQLI
ncbi:hypothetical protein JCM5350_003960 [Sporobolomyces pararoseus]